MITVKEVDRTYFDLYDQISMNVEVHSIYKLKRLDSGLSGLIFDEVPVKECIKDYSQLEFNVQNILSFFLKRIFNSISLFSGRPNLT